MPIWGAAYLPAAALAASVLTPLLATAIQAGSGQTKRFRQNLYKNPIRASAGRKVRKSAKSKKPSYEGDPKVTGYDPHRKYNPKNYSERFPSGLTVEKYSRAGRLD